MPRASSIPNEHAAAVGHVIRPQLHIVKPGMLHVAGLRNPYISIEALVGTGRHGFELLNGAVGQFIFTERLSAGKPAGFYLGFSLKNPASEDFTIYGRVAFDYERKQTGFFLVHGGYETARIGKPAGECVELAEDRSTPIFVSEGIREGYKGVGTVLMHLAMQIAISKGAGKIKIAQSLSEQSDSFYESLGFYRPRKQIANYDFDLIKYDFDQYAGIKVADASISASWRPREPEPKAEQTLPQPKHTPWWVKLVRIVKPEIEEPQAA